MRLGVLYLVSALAVSAIPLSAGAQPDQPNSQTASAPAPTAPQPGACRRPGWVWVRAGIVTHGVWRPVHCAPLYLIPFSDPDHRRPLRRSRGIFVMMFNPAAD